MNSSLFSTLYIASKNLYNITIRSIIISSLVCIPSYSFPIRNSTLIQSSPKEVIDQVWQIIYRDYMDSNGKYEKKKWLKIRNKLLANRYNNSEDSYEAIRGMLSVLEDPYTRFLSPKEFNQMRIDTSGELTGIGIQISIDENSNNIIVIAPIEGAPAFNAGILANDLIISIDGNQTKGMSIDKVVSLIRGKIGSYVNLGILRGNEIINLTIVRDRIEISSVSSKINYLNSGISIGYIRLKQFSANASKEMRRTLLSLEKKGLDAYVIDLRNNPGGLLESSIDISRQLLNKGIIVSTKTKSEITNIRRARGNALTSKPIAILVNEGSASASEILSGAIQDNNRGILVGKKTFGKGLVQSVRPLVDGSGLTVTVAKYLTPNGTDIHKNGIIPDIQASLVTKNKTTLLSEKLGSASDNQYSIAVKALIKLLSNQRKNNIMYVPSKSNFKLALEKAS